MAFLYPLLKTLSLPIQRYILKVSCRTRLAEAITTVFIAKNTTIPVAQIHDVFQRDGYVYILQEYIDAPLLWSVWWDLGVEERVKCMKELKGYIDQLRSLSPPHPERVQAVDGQCLTDSRMGDEDTWGPFETHRDFLNHFDHDRVRSHPRTWPHAQEALAKTQGRTWRTVFAHGDLGPHNILWDVKGAKIAAIIDWEFAGWFPEYWDYTRMYFGPASFRKNMGWWELFKEHNDCYPDELDVEIVLSNYFVWNL